MIQHSATTHQPALEAAPLYSPAYEHDSCGVGLVVDIKGRPSRDIVEKALAGLVNLTHRGGVGADARTGDGAGLLIQVPHGLFGPELEAAGATGLAAGDYGVAMVFLPQDPARQQVARDVIASTLAQSDLEVILWRDVPVKPEVLGQTALATRPDVAQVLIRRNANLDIDTFERNLMLGRRAIERAAAGVGLTEADLSSPPVRRAPSSTRASACRKIWPPSSSISRIRR
jgi:glutamate synthase (NADPH) large chain